MQYIPTNIYRGIQCTKMKCRRFGLSTFWFVDVSVCRCFGLRTFWSVDILVCQRFGLLMFRSVDVSVCRCFGLSTFWFVKVLVCRRFGLSMFGLSNFWSIDVSVCWRFGLSMFWLSTFRFVDLLTSYPSVHPFGHPNICRCIILKSLDQFRIDLKFCGTILACRYATAWSLCHRPLLGIPVGHTNSCICCKCTIARLIHSSSVELLWHIDVQEHGH